MSIQTVLVTGGGHGIGRGIVNAFLAQGARVASLDIKPMPLDAPADRYLSLQGDVGNPDDAEAAVARCYETWGQLNVLVNNAGIYPNKLVVDMELDDWHKVWHTNVDGPFLLSRAFARRLLAAKQMGCIINISSGAARSGRSGASHYCSSKAAVEMFTRVLAMELAPHGIRVNCVAPGLVMVREPDPVTSPIGAAYVNELMRTVPMARAGKPAEIADVVVFLASEGARYMTGETVNVDGGAGAGRNQLPRSGT
jgi:3-oxoacyl-[acyl-carrier protein] reductase